ncbi:uncharacterized protein LOC110459796 [Mizuhopecten yessoensis]|uniref:Proline-rich transmembrane protein 3/4 domain-containing protein n=1 Tax=Mizuhopecten yessoensis TaxID=6573 RepID=A0A210Q3S1_MIZYE|nr:uncharacterized protein LOC110459796 [Mizuhopecten yessoensis]OWF43391.1 hypothetical protein KP79_PYT21785 [Mizuhopecten yessoensis]
MKQKSVAFCTNYFRCPSMTTGDNSSKHHYNSDINWTVNVWGVPDWSIVSGHWTLAWLSYVYVFCMVYLIILGFDLVLYAKFQRRLARQRLLNTLLCYVTVCNLLLFGFHVVDPYGYYGRIPHIVTRVVWKLPYPVLSGTFCLLQMVIMKLTRLDIPSIQLNGYCFLVLATGIYTAEIVIIETLIYLSTIPAKLSFITDAIYVVYVVYLSCCFVYGAPKIARYASEAQRAKKELSSHSLSKIDKKITEDGRNKTRINYPRIRTNQPGNRISLLSDDSSGSDSKHESSFIEKKMAIRREKTAAFAAWYKNTFSRDRPNYNKKSWRSQNNMFCNDKVKIKTYNSSGSLDGSMTLHDYSSLNEDSGNERSSFTLPHSSSYDLITNTHVTSKASFRNRACRERHSTEKLRKKSKDVRNDEKETSVPMLLNPSILITNETKIFESGYIADVERISLYSEDDDHYKCKSNRRRRKHEEFVPDLTLPNSSSFLSFQRLRQGRMLNELVRYTYALTAFVMLSCIGSVYGLFNLTSRGLQYSPAANPVSWLIINFFQRFVEAVILLICSAAVYTSVSFRPHKTRKKRVKRVQDSCSGCENY